ncbi:hypothetical protein PMAYCL1PPCAC_28748, partial [Pristionchus mayeri]
NLLFLRSRISMADGDATPPISHGLLTRENEGRRSYFFDLQVMLCRSEQFKLVSYLLAQKEKEYQITFKKPFSNQFECKPQIDNVFVNLMLDSDVPVNLDSLIDDLRSHANKNPGVNELTRLLDLLYVSRKLPLLLEELDIRKVSYDLYDSEAHGKFGPLATYSKISSDTAVNNRSHEMALVFSMLATGQNEVVAAALVHLANVLHFPWDALILARYVFGKDNEVTKTIRKIWTKSVMKDDQFRVIKIALALKHGNPKDLARELIANVSNKETDPTEIFNAYRCLAIALYNSASLPEVERNLEVAETCKVMRSIYVTLLGWGKIYWAKLMMDDLSNRASPGGIPSYVCKIALNSHIELVELLLGLVNSQSGGGVITSEGMFKKLGLKWRTEINREHGEMSKLKTDTPGFQSGVYEWLTQFATVMRAPLLEESDLNKKMECVYLAFEFLQTMLGWAAAPRVEGGEEPLRLFWPERNFSFSIKDESIVLPALLPRSRTLSAGSSRSATTIKEDGKKQKKKGETKGEQPSMPLHDSNMGQSRIMGGQQHKDRYAQQVHQSMPYNGASGDHKKFTCYKCNKEGHFQINCPNDAAAVMTQDVRALLASCQGQYGQPQTTLRPQIITSLANSTPRGSTIDQLPPPSISGSSIDDHPKNNQLAAFHQNVVSTTMMHQPTNVDGGLSNGVLNLSQDVSH